MVSPDQPAVQVRAVQGWTEKGAFLLTPGTKPVAMGTQAQWVLVAEGVAPVHLYFAFDGANVYVAPASPAQTVLLAGIPLGPGWTTAKVPSEIRFGAATLMLEPALGVSVPTSSAPSSPNTVSDGGALWEAAQKAVQAAQVAPPPAAQAAHPLGPLASTIVMVPNPAAGALLQEALAPPQAVQGTALAPSGAGYASPQQRMPSVPPGNLLAPGGSPRQETALAPDWGQPPQGSAQPPEQSSPATTEPEAKPGFWKGTSGTKKATLLLMPLLLVASYYLLFMDPARHPPAPRPKPPVAGGPTASPSNGGAAKEGAKSASSRATASDLALRPDAGAAVASGGAASSANVPDMATNAGGGAANGRAGRSAAPVQKPVGKTPERAALDAVAAGSFEDAAKAYEALAAQHPDDVTLREAARILHQKAERSR
jgi:hypothetical protein